MDQRTNRPTGGLTDGRTEGWTDGRTDRPMDGRMDGHTDGWTDGQTDRWMDGRMDGLTDEKNARTRMDGRTLVVKLRTELEITK